jgi:hypothetical protein
MSLQSLYAFLISTMSSMLFSLSLGLAFKALAGL